jgi:sugar lactone lactonase YvrE
VVATSFAAPGGLRVISVKDKTSTVAYPSATAKERFDKTTYAACPGAPDAAHQGNIQTHGVALREGKNNLHTLYVVNHSRRESIEVFELDARANPPALTWTGCVVAPDEVGLNEVVPLPDGGFIGTDFSARGAQAQASRGQMTAGQVNGALWEWHSGAGWKKVPGSEASGANGLEISKDGKTLYVAAWGSQSFFRMSLGQTPVKRDDIPLGFRADNVRWAPDGTLYVTGQGQGTTNIVKIDPNTLKVTEIRKEPSSAAFSNGTVTVQVGKELWVGTFRGDRIAVYPAP